MSKYLDYDFDKLEEHFSNFRKRSFSVSGTKTFSRNQALYEMEKLAGIYDSRKGVSQVVGSAYDDALNLYFNAMKDARPEPSFEDLCRVAFMTIDDVKPEEWRTTKKRDWIQSKDQASKKLTTALKNFWDFRLGYTKDIEKVLWVQGLRDEFGKERSMQAWISLCGEDLPLPIKFRIDVMYLSKDGHLVIRDNKCVSKFTDNDHVTVKYGDQAIAYTKAIEALIDNGFFDEMCPEMKGKRVSRFEFYENKNTMNRDGSPQTESKSIEMTEDARSAYEILFHIQKVMPLMKALQDPDHVFQINQDDMMCDMPALKNFVVEALVEETYQVPNEAARAKFKNRPRAKVDMAAAKKFIASQKIHISLPNFENMTLDQKLVTTLRYLGYDCEVYDIVKGFTCDTYLIRKKGAHRADKISSYVSDVKMALDAEFVRIPSHPVRYDGKMLMSIEVGREDREYIEYDQGSMAEEISSGLIPLGMDNLKNNVYWDLNDSSQPHSLVAGTTGSGKSALAHHIIKSFDKYCDANGGSMIIMDPKHEFSSILGESHQDSIHTDPGEIVKHTKNVLRIMDERYAEGINSGHKKLMVVFDELADVFAWAEQNIKFCKRQKITSIAEDFDIDFQRILQKGRAANIHILAITQRPSVQIIKGDTKANFPVRIALRNQSGIDSRTILDSEDAKDLLGKGDAIIDSAEHNMIRFQSFFIKD